ncbi:MAG: aldehyde ferredoxin oxidoreductase C-terminal domain-containing protein, partial [Pseudomonadota bacterium]
MPTNQDKQRIVSSTNFGMIIEPKILLIDLDSHIIKQTKLANKYYKYIGGRLLSWSLYRDYCDRDSLIFSTTPLNSRAYKRHLNGRVILVGKSPLTGNIYSSNSGGPLGTWLAHKGYLAVIILGSAKKPIYVDLELMEFTSAIPKKGKLIPLQAAFSGCSFAILKDFSQTNFPEGIFGRGGFGKAFIEKNIVGLGYGNLSESKKDLPISVETFLKQRHPSNTRPFQDNFYAFGVSKILIKNNWRELSAKDSMFTTILQQIEKSELDENPIGNLSYSRYGSTGNVSINMDDIIKVKGPQNQTAEMIGPNLGISTLQDIYNISYLCDKFGVDAISFGAVLACAMDLFKDGKLTIEQTDGIELKFGDVDVIIRCLHKICNKDDKTEFTSRLGGGVKNFAELYGFPEYAMQTKGLSFTAYYVINNPFLALLFATS